MRFNPKARLDRSQVQDRRGGGGGGLGLPAGGGGGRGIKVGGGVGGLVVLLLVVLLNGGLDGLTTGGGDAGAGSSDDQSLARCRTGVDANRDEDCARVAVVNSIQAFWTEALPQQADREYVEATTRWFSDQVSTGCGTATSAVGPFYCPPDQRVYLDLTFFDAMLERQLGAAGGDFAEAYVVGHEYGHHVQNLLGIMGQVRTQQGAQSDAVRLELQADCLAGMWTKHAIQVPDERGTVFISELTRADITEALDAASAVGDDRIQQKTSGRVNPEAWTHGSAEQRRQWFTRGLEEGSLRACDTFSATRL